MTMPAVRHVQAVSVQARTTAVQAGPVRPVTSAATAYANGSAIPT